MGVHVPLIIAPGKEKNVEWSNQNQTVLQGVFDVSFELYWEEIKCKYK